MGKFIDEGANHFRIDYFTPFTGIDSGAPSYFIKPSSVYDCTNVLVRDARYIPTQWEEITFGGGPILFGNSLIGFGELPFIGVSGAQQYQPAGYFAITANYIAGNAVITAYQGNDITTGLTARGTVTVPVFGQLGRLTYVTINQVVYLSAPGLSAILQLAMVPGSLTFAFTLTILTSYLGCSYLGELSGRLLAFNVWQYTAGSPATFINYPYQVAWSADSEQYGIWNVLDISGNPTGAGFNNLPDVEDVITGFQMEGPTCYIYRQQGITEMSPLNSGIDPFDFNHMWASKKGIGTVYANSMSQYGSEGAFLSDTDVFTMGLSGLQAIGGDAKNAIFGALYSSSVNVYGLVSPITCNNEPELCYILMMQTFEADSDGFHETTFFIYSYTTKVWTKLVLLSVNFLFIVDCQAMTKLLLDGATSSAIATYIQPVFAFQDGTSTPKFYTINNNSDVPVPVMLLFPTEMIAPFREVTVDGIAFATEADDSGSIVELLINGQQFDNVVTGTTPDDPPGFYKSYPPTDKPAITVRNPQLQVLMTGSASINYIGIYGTQAVQRPF